MSCLGTALRLLAIRDLTEHQLRSKLEARQHDRADVDDVIARLRSDGMLNDERLARARAKAEAERGRKGPHRVRRELEAAGISSTIAKAAVKEAFAETDSVDALSALLEKRLRGAKTVDEAQYRKTYQFLVRRGFDSADIAAALRKYSRRF